MSLWETPLNLLGDELIQSRDEGAAVPEEAWKRFWELTKSGRHWDEALIWPLLDQVAALPRDPELEAREPSELGAIRALRPQGPRRLALGLSDDEMLDRFHGAWTGRAAGCALGKPVEAMGMRHRDGRLSGRAEIKGYLQRRGDWPLVDYFSRREVGDGEFTGPWENHMKSWREVISYMEPDDDIHYSLVGLHVLEKKGAAFGWKDLAETWITRLPLDAICTAERQAILNFSARSAGAFWARSVPAEASFTRSHRNPYREWIGAQIRSDGWAWCCAGNPELAAEFAWRDASWTHTRNGIYGAMFMAAAQAAAFGESDPEALAQIGLSEIPADCRLARLIRKTMEICRGGGGWESQAAKVDALCEEISPTHLNHGEEVRGMNPVHTFNNAALCVLALFHGKMDPQSSICTAVMCGLDTDCNGATVGSIVGAASGRRSFPESLAGPLHDTIRPSMIGFEQSSMHDLALRTRKVWKSLAGAAA